MAKSTTKNDQLIISLKKQIDEKRGQLDRSTKFTPKTNCSLVLAGERHNLHTLTKSGLEFCLVHLNALKLAADDLGLTKSFDFNGFKLTDWIDDVKTKLLIVDRKAEEQRLQSLEAQLEQLLSQDKKIELQLEKLKEQI